jgi:hypothetical protein
MIWIEPTFNYRFDVRASAGGGPSGSEALGSAAGGSQQGKFGPKPRFELLAGWLALFPSEGCVLPLRLDHFSVDTRPKPAIPAPTNFAAFFQLQSEPPDPAALAREQVELEERMRVASLWRNLTSFSLFVGEALHNLLETGDRLTFVRNGNGAFQYFVRRNAETIFSAGSVYAADTGETTAVWQEHEIIPTPEVDALRKQHPKRQFCDTIQLQKPYISVRIRDRFFQLIDGEQAQSDPYYVFLARSNNRGGAITGYAPPAVHAAGRISDVSRELIADAAQQLTEPKTKIL